MPRQTQNTPFAIDARMLGRQGTGVATYAGALRAALELQALPVDFGADVYDLAFVFPGADPRERLPHRRPGWAHLD